METLMEEYGAVITGVIAVIVMIGILAGMFTDKGMLHQFLSTATGGLG